MFPGSSLHHHHLPLPVRRDVRGPGPRAGDEPLRPVDGADGEEAEEEAVGERGRKMHQFSRG